MSIYYASGVVLGVRDFWSFRLVVDIGYLFYRINVCIFINSDKVLKEEYLRCEKIWSGEGVGGLREFKGSRKVFLRR